MAVALVMGCVLALVAANALAGSPFAQYGWGLDQSFRTAYVTKLAAHWGPVDFAAAGLGWFYPPLYFLGLARVSNVLGVEPWEMLKIGVIATASLVPLVSVGLWSRVVSWQTAGAFAISTLVVQEWYEPYAWVAAVAFIPWVIGVWQVERPDRRRMLLLAVVGMVIACTYHAFIPVAVVMLAGTLIAGRWVRDVAPRDWRAVLIVAGGVIALSSWYWLPFAWSIAQHHGTWEMLQDRYWDPSLARFPRPFLDFTLPGVIMLGGLAHLLVRHRQRVERLLLALLVATYAWWALGLLAVDTAGTTLNAHRSRVLIGFVLAAAAALGLLDLSRRWHRTTIAVVVGLVVAFVAVAPIRMYGVEERAGITYPAELVDEYETLSGPGERVVLTDLLEIPEFVPEAFVFNAWSAHYAHPLAGFHDRVRFVRALAREPDPAVVALILAENRFQAIDQVVFRAGGELVQWYADDNFPNWTLNRSVTFPPAAFGALDRTDGPMLVVFDVPPASKDCSTVAVASRRFRHDRSDRLATWAASCSGRGTTR